MAEQSLPHQEPQIKILTFITILIHNSGSFLKSQELQPNEENTYLKIIFYKTWHLFFSLTETSSKFKAKSPPKDKSWAVILKGEEKRGNYLVDIVSPNSFFKV